MKKILLLVMSIVVLLQSVSLSLSADGTDNFEFIVDGVEYTVQFIETDLSHPQQALVAAYLVGADYSEMINGNDGESINNLWCTLFGHNYTTSSVGIITHKYRSSQPRCKNDIYNVQVCDRCEDTVKTLVSTSYIYCCD